MEYTIAPFDTSTELSISSKIKLPKQQIKMRIPKWIREMVAEMIGTYLLVMMGDCAIANYKLNKSKVGVDQFAVAFTFGIGAMAGIAASQAISGSHLNPAVTLAFAFIQKIPFRKIPHYFLGQYLGAFLAACTVSLTYYEGIQAFHSGTVIGFVKNNQTLVTMASGDIFATFPSPWVTILGALIDQIVATFALVFCILAVTNRSAKLPQYLHPFMLGLVICGMVIAFGLNCGAVLNPARDLSPRLFLLLNGYGLDAFKPIGSLYWLMAGVIGPHIGAIIAAFSYEYLLWYNDDDDGDNMEMIDLNQIETKQNLQNLSSTE